jgi:hypothetical protein
LTGQPLDPARCRAEILVAVERMARENPGAGWDVAKENSRLFDTILDITGNVAATVWECREAVGLKRTDLVDVFIATRQQMRQEKADSAKNAKAAKGTKNAPVAVPPVAAVAIPIPVSTVVPPSPAPAPAAPKPVARPQSTPKPVPAAAVAAKAKPPQPPPTVQQSLF